MAPPILILRDIDLTFGGTPLLQGAEMSVSQGDRLCLVGRNGSGKSTLMKIIAGQIAADSGEIFVQPSVTVRYLPQEPDLSGFTDVLSYVEAGLAPGDDPYRANYLLQQLGLRGGEDPVARAQVIPTGPCGSVSQRDNRTCPTHKTHCLMANPLISNYRGAHE